jgi:hypothetical protein
MAPSLALAQADDEATNAPAGDDGLAAPELTFQPVIGFRSINQATSTVVALAFLGGAILAFYYLIKGAYRYVTAGDNAGNAQEARTTIQNAIIGLLILGTVYVIFRFAVNLIPGLSTFFS